MSWNLAWQQLSTTKAIHRYQENKMRNVESGVRNIIGWRDLRFGSIQISILAMTKKWRGLERMQNKEFMTRHFTSSSFFQLFLLTLWILNSFKLCYRILFPPMFKRILPSWSFYSRQCYTKVLFPQATRAAPRTENPEPLWVLKGEKSQKWGAMQKSLKIAMSVQHALNQ